MTTTLILDLDGTILDTLDDLTAGVNHALEVHGFAPHSRDNVRGFVGDGVKNLCLRALRADGIEPSEELVQQVLADFKTYYGEHGFDCTRPYDGILPFLEECRHRGLKVGVVSNKHDAMVKTLCAHFFGGLVPVARGEDTAHGIPKKPDPAGVFLVMEELGCRPEETVYIGDSDQDIMTAKNAGLPCISVTWGFRSESFLREHGATLLCREPSGIFSLLP